MENIRLQRLKYVLADFLTANISFLAFNYYRFFYFHIAPFNSFASFVSSGKMIIEQIIIPLTMLGIYWISGYYNHPYKKSRLQELTTTFVSALFATFLIYLALLTNDQSMIVSTNYMMLLTLLGLIFTPTYLSRLLITSHTIKAFKRRNWKQPAIIIGASKVGKATADNLSDPRLSIGYNVVGFVEIPGENRAAELPAKLVSFDELPGIVRSMNVSQIFISPETFNDRTVLSYLYRLFPLGTSIRIAPDTLDYVTSSIHLQDIYAEPFVDLSGPRLGESSKNIKRLIDIFFSLTALIMLAIPVMVIALMVKHSSPGPVFYRQRRIGYRQKPFNIIKFRTMYTDAESNGPQLTSDSDSRITPIGHILRKYRLDEVPQFINVLKGDMSIVGPRPEREFFIRQIVEKAPYYTLVHQVRPGITSWGMVKYGYASSVDQMVARTRYDLVYLANMSVSVDFKIMIYTIRTVLGGKGK